MIKKVLVIFTLILFLGLAWRLDLFARLDFYYIKAHLNELQSLYEEFPVKFFALYFCLYVLVTSLSLPGGATLLTLLGGAVMGFFPAFVTVAFASSTGATLAFWASRFLFKDLVEKKFKAQARIAKEEVEKNGIYYLLTLRFVPVFPFFLVNILMGLTAMRPLIFFMVSLIGMLPAIAIFVLTGRTFSQINSPEDIVSLKLILLLSLTGLLPMLLKFILEQVRVRKLYRRFRSPEHFDYNTIVIGAGAGGLVSALITSSLKAKVALIEKHKMGGDCLYTGCVPSKALINAAKYSHLTNEPVDFSQVMTDIKKTQSEIEPHDSKERYTSFGVDCLEGEATVLSPFEVLVNGKKLRARNLIIATGARPRLPSVAGLDKVPYLTSDTLWSLSRLPEKLLILGAGPIGCEMAQAFRRLGAEVVLVEGGKGILPKEDADVSELVEKKFRSEGVQLFLYTEAKEFIANEGKYFLKAESLGKDILIDFDYVLLATGRVANVKGFGLEDIGIDLNSNGTIKTNVRMQTNFPNIYACGDVTGPYQLTHMAGYQAWFAAVNSLFGSLKLFSTNYRSVSWCTFTDPEVATVGLNENVLRQKEQDYEVTKFSFSDLDRAIIDRKTDGFVKVMTKKGSDKILGATIVGPEAGLLILEFVCAIKYNKGMKDILNTIHPYPTLSEANKYAAGLWQKNHAPELVLSLLEKIFRWRRK